MTNYLYFLLLYFTIIYVPILSYNYIIIQVHLLKLNCHHYLLFVFIFFMHLYIYKMLDLLIYTGYILSCTLYTHISICMTFSILLNPIISPY